MLFVGCSVSERFLNPLFEVFDGGDFVLSSYHDIEERDAEVRIYFECAAAAPEAERRLRDALKVVGIAPTVVHGELADEDWRFAYRRHFKIDPVGERLLIVPTWEMAGLKNPEGRAVVELDPGMAFGTGKHETTRACLEFIEDDARKFGPGRSFLDMGSGSGILSIAAAKLGFAPVRGFDVDEEAVRASVENAALNQVRVEYARFALGRRGESAAERFGGADFVVANILGPLLIRFAAEIAPCVRARLVLSGILTELYPEVLSAYAAEGFVELERRTLGEWTTGLLQAPKR